MRQKVLISLLIVLILVITGCQNQGELIYQDQTKLDGDQFTGNYLNQKQATVITPQNIESLRGELRGIQNLELETGLAVYVTLGKQPSGGYQIKIKEIRQQEKKLYVTVKAVGPAPEESVTQVITYPQDVVKVPLTKDEINQVVFLSTQQEKLITLAVN
ncbi:protease complex subunit PrcB family protein [Halanaerobaculum tunisiense]